MSGRLTISLSAVAANYQRLARHARGEVAAVVKADGYGLGAVPIARRLNREGCREYFVATAAEGVQLRHALPEAAIYVLAGAYPENLSELVDAGLIPVLNTHAQCRLWADVQRPAALHMDSGMQRLGFDYSLGVESLAELPFNVCLFVSHFARADEPGHDSLARQMQRTMSLYTSLQSRHDTMRLSLCNSAGLLEGLGPEDLGRAGIALYGGNPYHDLPNPMQSVVGLQARVMQLRDVPPNTPVGYGGSFVTRRATRLAVLGVGYADGVPRLLSNNGAVILADRPCAIVGRVSMDLICVDVSEFSAEQVVEGDWAEVIGPRVSLDDVAVAAQTLAYEILTGLSTRVPRSYVEEPL